MTLIIDTPVRDLLIHSLSHLAGLLEDVRKWQGALAERGATPEPEVERLCEIVPPTLDALLVEAALDRLIATPGWRYPTQVLPAPVPEFGELLAACEKRRARARGRDRREVEIALVKLRQAHRITREARARRRARRNRQA